MHFHSYPFKLAGNQILLDVWHQLSQKIQLSFVLSQVIVPAVELIETNERYVEIALGERSSTRCCARSTSTSSWASPRSRSS